MSRYILRGWSASAGARRMGGRAACDGKFKKNLSRGQAFYSFMVRPVGIEPTAYGLEGRCSIR